MGKIVRGDFSLELRRKHGKKSLRIRDRFSNNTLYDIDNVGALFGGDR